MQVDLGSVKCALVVCDTEWRGCSSSEESGEEHLAAADYLRLDSMVGSFRLHCSSWNTNMIVQTNGTKAWLPMCLPDAVQRARKGAGHVCHYATSGVSPKSRMLVQDARVAERCCISRVIMGSVCSLRDGGFDVQILVAQLNIRTALEVCPCLLAWFYCCIATHIWPPRLAYPVAVLDSPQWVHTWLYRTCLEAVWISWLVSLGLSMHHSLHGGVSQVYRAAADGMTWSVLRVQEQNRPDINIVCEKIAFQGLTRFENREALPLGVSTNFTAYSAKLLTQASSSACLDTSNLRHPVMTSGHS